MSNAVKLGTWVAVGALLVGACGGPPALEAQSIDFPPLSDRVASSPPFEVVASATSGLPVSFASEGPCSVAGSIVTLSGDAGECTITASQPGNGAYRAADDVARSFEVTVEIRQLGFVLLTEAGPDGARGVDASGSFVERSEPIVDVFPEGPFGSGAGDCQVTSVIADDGGDPLVPAPEAGGTPIDAGTPLTVRSGGLVYATLTSDEVGTYRLSAVETPSVPLPSVGLTLDVPGAAFTAFEGAGFEDTARFAVDPAFDAQNVTRDTSFGWEGAEGDASVALLIGGGGGVVFSCVVPDVGSFSFDDATKAALDDAGFVSGELQAAGRLSVTATVQNETALLLGVLRTEALTATLGGTAVDALQRQALLAVARRTAGEGR
jgi:hypothetical protein